MTARLVSPGEAVALLARRVEQRWTDAVCGEPVTFSIPLRPGVTTGKAVELDAAFALAGRDSAELDRARTLLAALRGSAITPATLRAMLRLPAAESATLLEAVAWLCDHPDLWFPPVPDTIVVEGGGKAAAATLSTIPWLRAAEHVVYWGDMDADGYAILDRFRAAAAAQDGAPGRSVPSILMEGTDLHRYARHGVGHDRNGRRIDPCTTRLHHPPPPRRRPTTSSPPRGPPPSGASSRRPFRSPTLPKGSTE